MRMTLLLLDDADRHAGPDSSDWEKLTDKHVAAARAPKIKPAATTSPLLQRKAAPENRIFSSSPSLKQMMGEYNRSHTGNAPIRVTSPRPSSEGFTSDRVDFIDLPAIPGKILRPTNADS